MESKKHGYEHLLYGSDIRELSILCFEKSCIEKDFLKDKKCVV